MAQILIKRSSSTGVVPTTSELNLGELAVNTRDGRVFFKQNNGVSDFIRDFSVVGNVETFSNKTFEAGVNGNVFRINGSNSITGVTGTGSTLALSNSPTFTGTVTFTGNISIPGTGYLSVPAGTTAERPDPASNGMFRYNTTLNQFEGYTPSGWGSIGGGGGTGGGGGAFIENANSVTQDYTLPAGKNAVSAGPLTIQTGITVTIPSGQAWVIV